MGIRVVLAEDSYLVREGISLLFETQPDLDLAAVCGDFDSAVHAVESQEPDVVLTDIRMPPDNADEGIRLAGWLRQERPGVGVVVLSSYADAQYAVELFASGSEGRAYLLKERIGDVDELAGAIRAVSTGGTVLDPVIVDALVEARTGAAGSPLDRLTRRENEVLAQVAQGKNNPAIAADLYLSEKSVEKHISAIFSKLGLAGQDRVHRRVRAVLIYLEGSGD